MLRSCKDNNDGGLAVGGKARHSDGDGAAVAAADNRVVSNQIR